jgi:hypothetical protein
MTRSISLLVILMLLAASAGCRMCGSPYDYCISGYVDRADDYRGCDPFYRAGSVFYCSDSFETDGAIIANAGNYGNTTLIEAVNRKEDFKVNPNQRQQTPYRPSLTPIAKPPLPLGIENDSTVPIPDIDQILRDSQPIQQQMPLPKPEIPRTPQPAPKSETIPFVPNEPIQNVLPPVTTGEPTITIDELRRLDPSVTDIKIISIEDGDLRR